MSQYIIVIAGGTGFVGRKLALLLAQKHTVRILSRSRSASIEGCEMYYWNPQVGDFDKHAFKHATHVINLSGENISERRWTRAQKKRIMGSRLAALETLYVAIKNYGDSVQHVLSASAVGYYGTAFSDEICTEDSDAGTDFLAEVCVAWEQQVHRFSALHIPYTIVRLGVVLDANTGAFKKMMTSLPMRILGIPGSGRQYIPWIYISDVIRIFDFCISQQFFGVCNAVAHESTSYNTLYAAVQKQKPCLRMHIPAFFMRLVLGEMADILTKGNKISGNKICEHGFTCEYTDITQTVAHMLEQ